MSDTGRQSLTDKVSATVKPDSEKTNKEHFGDKVHGKTDNMKSSLQPESEKSYTQKAGDKLSGNNTGHTTTSNNESFVQKTKNAVGLGDKH